EVLAAMAGHANDASAGEPPFQLGQPRREARLPFDAPSYPTKRIDHRVPGYVDCPGIDVLASQGLGGRLGRCAMERGERADDLTIALLGPRMVDVAAPQPSFDMRDRDLAIVGRESARHGGRRVALDDDPVGPLIDHHAPQPGQQGCGEGVERLVGPHQVEVVIGLDAGDLQHLIEHPAMLRTDAHPAFEATIGLDRVDERKELYRFRPRAEYGENTPGHPAIPSANVLNGHLPQSTMSPGSTTTGALEGADGGATSPASSFWIRSRYCRSSSSTRAWVAAASASMVESRSSRAWAISSAARTLGPPRRSA